MTQVTLWTQQVEVTWPACLSFYDEKLNLLHQFESEGILRAFRNRDTNIGAMLGDPDHHIAVRSDQMNIRMLSSGADLERMESAASSVFSALEPDSVAEVSVSLQYLTPLDGEFQSLTGDSANRLLGLTDEGGMGGWDWAVLLNGEGTDPDSIFQVEFGVVQAEEIPERLARVHGQIEGLDTSIPSSHWEGQEFPPVAMFAEWQWATEPSDEAAPLDTFLACWARAREDAASLLKTVGVTSGLLPKGAKKKKTKETAKPVPKGGTK
jgi:hypothetical protein